MTEDQMIASSRAIVVAIEHAADVRGLETGDRVALAGMALSEWVAQHCGPVGAVEYLRDLADTIEGELLKAVAN